MVKLILILTNVTCNTINILLQSDSLKLNFKINKVSIKTERCKTFLCNIITLKSRLQSDISLEKKTNHRYDYTSLLRSD